MATINPTQDYDIIHTLTFSAASGNCPILLYRGSSTAMSGTVYYREGTSGTWASLSVSGTTTTFPISSTTMQVGHDWNKSGDDYMTASFMGATTITEIAISQKAVLSGTMGSNFMFYYAFNCTNLTTLDVPDTSGLTSVGNYFMDYYAFVCSGLASLDVPDTSNITTVGDYFMRFYARACSNLTTLAVPDTSCLTTVGDYFMGLYAYDCTNLTSLILPTVGWFVTHDVDWGVPAARLGYLKGYVLDSDDLSDWQALTASTKTLYINYIRDSEDVEVYLSIPTVTTSACTLTDNDSTQGNGNITDTGGENCTRRGFCYIKASSGDPTTADSVVYDDGDFGTGAFSKAITGLDAGSTYRVRAYAVNSAGTGYGTTVDVTTYSAIELSCSDGFKVSDTAKANLTIGLSATDGISGGDSTSHAYIANPIASDGIKLSETVIPNLIMPLEVSDGISLSDQALPSIVIEMSASDIVNMADTPIATIVKELSASDGITLSDDGGDWTETAWQPETATLGTDDTYYKDIADLSPSTRYEFQTQAKNSGEEGEWSSSNIFKTEDS